MRPFSYTRPRSLADASRQLVDGRGATMPIFGGTTLLDLAKLGVLQPTQIVDLKPLARAHRDIRRDDDDTIAIGAFATMAQAAADPLLASACPAATEALVQAASPQIRNMASLAGNLLQRTRCTYYRDDSWARCNRRSPGSGCQAIDGVATQHAVLGVSAHCIAAYPGDFATVLAAFEAQIVVQGPDGRRTVPFAALHRLPGDMPDRETTLRPGELILEIRLPPRRWLARSAYVKLRHRASYAFAEASAAVALEIDKGVVVAARIGLGGVAAIPWRSEAAEAALVGHAPDDAERAADAAFAAAVVRPDTEDRVLLGKRVLLAAIAAAMPGHENG